MWIHLPSTFLREKKKEDPGLAVVIDAELKDRKERGFMASRGGKSMLGDFLRAVKKARADPTQRNPKLSALKEAKIAHLVVECYIKDGGDLDVALQTPVPPKSPKVRFSGDL